MLVSHIAMLEPPSTSPDVVKCLPRGKIISGGEPVAEAVQREYTLRNAIFKSDKTTREMQRNSDVYKLTLYTSEQTGFPQRKPD